MEKIPTDLKVAAYLDGADFEDCFSATIEYENQSALDLFLIIARNTPSWVNQLMSLRNQIVSKMGLKDLGEFADIDGRKTGADYCVSDRVGIFTVHTHTHNEVILEDRDKHLGVKVSLFIEPNGDTAKVYISSVVHIKNKLGKVYMFFVAPVHKIIVPATLKSLVKHTSLNRRA
jgi:hypothetical protein